MQAGRAEYVLSAQDQTAAAFAKVNANLDRLSANAADTGKKMEKGLKVGLALFLGTELMGALRKLGGEMFNIANATSKIDAGKLQAMHQSLDKAGQSFKSMASMIGAQLAPYIQMAADMFVKAMGDGEGFRRVMHAAFVGLVRAVGIFADAWRAVEIVWTGLELGFTGMRLLIIQGLMEIDKTIVDVVNKLPGVHIEYSKTLEIAAKVTKGTFEQIRKDLDVLMKSPLPSAGMLEAVKQIDAASAKQGEVLANAQAKQGEVLANAQAKQGEVLANAQAKQVAANQKELETVEAHKVEMGAVRMTWNEKEAEEEDARREREYQAQLKEYGQFAWMVQAKASLEQKSMKSRIAGVSTLLGQAANLMQSDKKKEFEFGKKAAIANALIGMGEGIGKAWGLPFPLNVAAVALVAANSMMNIRQLRAQQFNGGGAANVGASASMPVDSTGLPSGGMPSGAIPEAPTLPQASNSGGPQRNVVIRVEGDNGMVSMDWVRNKLAPAIQEAAGDGVKFMVA